MEYRGPKERLEAANSLKTTPEELAQLANSEYGFVLAAVAANPNTPPDALEKMVPPNLFKQSACEVVLGLLRNQNLPSGLFLQIEMMIELAAPKISPRAFYENEIIKNLASSSKAPLAAILPLANDSLMPRHIRSRIANSETRSELLQLLMHDPSERISKMAAKSLKDKENKSRRSR